MSVSFIVTSVKFLFLTEFQGEALTACHCVFTLFIFNQPGFLCVKILQLIILLLPYAQIYEKHAYKIV